MTVERKSAKSAFHSEAINFITERNEILEAYALHRDKHSLEVLIKDLESAFITMFYNGVDSADAIDRELSNV